MLRTQYHGQAGKLGLMLVFAELMGVSMALRHPERAHVPESGRAPVHPDALHASPHLRAGRAARKRDAPPATTPHVAKDSVLSTPITRTSSTASGPWQITEGYQLLVLTGVLTATSFVIGLAVWWSTPCGRGGEHAAGEVQESAGTAPLCRSEAWAAAASLLATVAQGALPGCVWVPVCGLLADSVVHTSLLLRVVVGFVDAQHASALLGYGRGVLRWSVWFDAKANTDALQAASTWCCLCFALLLFALVSLGGAVVTSADSVRIQWHVLLSYLVLVLAILLRDSEGPRAKPPLLALGLNALAGAGELHGAGMLALAFAAAVLLVEAETARRFAEWRPPGVYSDAPLVLPEDITGFEQHLHRERRLGLLYCWQELSSCERAWKREERAELWGTWVAQFAVPGAPFAVEGLSAFVKPRGSRADADEWGGAGTPPGGVTAARNWLCAQLRAAARRFEASVEPASRPPRWGQCLERDRADSDGSTGEPDATEPSEPTEPSESDVEAEAPPAAG